MLFSPRKERIRISLTEGYRIRGKLSAERVGTLA